MTTSTYAYNVQTGNDWLYNPDIYWATHGITFARSTAYRWRKNLLKQGFTADRVRIVVTDEDRDGRIVRIIA